MGNIIIHRRKKVDSGQFCGVFVVLLGKAGEKDYLIDSGCMSYSEIIGRLEMIKMRQYNMCAGVE